MRRPIAAFALAGLVLLTLAGLAASSLAQRRRPVLHEPLPAPPGPQSPSPVLGRSEADGNPAAIASGDKVLPAPALARPPRDPKEPVLGSKDFGADRSTEAPPDRNTQADGTLHYASVFNPDVLPFKRMSALDGVRQDYTLFVEHPGQTELPVGGTTDASRDRFWGSMLIELTPGNDVPLPSVAPDMRILSYETEPRVRLTFSKDGADNFFVRSDDSGSAGTYRLVFLADAAASYFAPNLPDDRRYTPRLVADLAPAELRPRLPDPVRRAAMRVLRDRIGVSDTYALDVVVNKLIEYFRGFEAKDPPPDTGDIYRDLCDSKAGVCRHRSFAFMITAGALGLPTRFVSNEAHAFVEMWMPRRGWLRIDLGGAALQLDVQGGDGKTLHRPRAEDPFEKPPEYRNNYTQLSGDIRGLSREQIADRQRPTSEAPTSGEFDADADPAGLSNRPASLDTGHITPDKSLPVALPDPAKLTPLLTNHHVDATAYRGGKLHVEGEARLTTGPLPGRPIDIYISREGTSGAGAVLLRRVVTGPDGRFAADLEIPSTLKLARHELHISSPEDAQYNAALSD